MEGREPPGAVTDASTRVAGIIGWPVEHSLSPAMHNAAFAALGLNWTYVAFPVHPDRAERAIAGLAAAGCAGLNATIPHKVAALRAASSASEAAVAIGAANTLVPDGDGGFRADNTDAAGFCAPSTSGRRSTCPAPMPWSSAPAGRPARSSSPCARAARACASPTAPRPRRRAGRPGALRPRGARRRRGAGRPRRQRHQPRPRGRRRPPELPLAALGPAQVVADVVYRPGGTPGWPPPPRGARTVDGLGMLLHQGAAAFAQWTGREPPLAAMRAALPGR